MENLILEATSDTPGVNLNNANGAIEFTGKSLPEDVHAFYGPVLDWIKEYSQTPAAKTLVTFKMTYFNTASSKVILDILMMFDELNEAKGGVELEWYFYEDDEDMEEAAEEFSDMIELPCKLIPME